MAFNPKDYYFQKAKAENFAARSVFKLQEMDQRFKILKPKDQVLDLGAAPGSWSQYASQKVGPEGRVVGIDLQPIRLTLSNALFLTADLRQQNLPELLSSQGVTPHFNIVLSDMAPKTTGIRITDQTRSMELCELALDLATQFLDHHGHFVCKLFHGETFGKLRDRLKENFRRVEVLRPKSTRKESKEIFFIALQFLGISGTIGTDNLD
jgi:23S rRNA (uridine2552-2'-O)-methyltransferase